VLTWLLLLRTEECAPGAALSGRIEKGEIIFGLASHEINSFSARPQSLTPIQSSISSFSFLLSAYSIALSIMNNHVLLQERRAASLNNQGVASLLNESYDEAISFFFSSLKTTRSQIRESTNASTYYCPRSGDLQCSTTKFNFLDPKYPHCGPRHLNPASFVSQRVVAVSDFDPDEGAFSLSIIANVALYNLALASHLSGLQKKCVVRLQRALRCYELSYKLQMQKTAKISPVPAMSVLNNIGTIYRLLNDQETSNKFFQHLLSAMVFFRETGEPDCMVGDTLSGFWSNVMSLILKNPCTAGAA
jgi:hypothetical protein